MAQTVLQVAQAGFDAKPLRQAFEMSARQGTDQLIKTDELGFCCCVRFTVVHTTCCSKTAKGGTCTTHHAVDLLSWSEAIKGDTP